MSDDRNWKITTFRSSHGVAVHMSKSKKSWDRDKMAIHFTHLWISYSSCWMICVVVRLRNLNLSIFENIIDTNECIMIMLSKCSTRIHCTLYFWINKSWSLLRAWCNTYSSSSNTTFVHTLPASRTSPQSHAPAACDRLEANYCLLSHLCRYRTHVAVNQQASWQPLTYACLLETFWKSTYANQRPWGNNSRQVWRAPRPWVI